MPFSLSVLTYNVFLRPRWLFPDGQRTRARLIADWLTDHPADVLVLNEAFDDVARRPILDALADIYPHRAPVGRDGWIRQDSGVVVMSRHPIARPERRTFRAWHGTDWLSKKGFTYTELHKEGRRVHLLATHLDAGRRGAARQRKKQLAQMRTFLDACQVPDGEPVVIAGDMNICWQASRLGLGDEYTEMHRILGSVSPERPEDALSYDTRRNELASGLPRHLDHVVHVHRDSDPPPALAENTVLRPVSPEPWKRWFRPPCHELSDHYPVLGRFEW